VPAASPGERNPLDAFIQSKLASSGLRPAPEADRRTLIRRLTFDLTGLPPTPIEVEAFLADMRPDAYERLVDRLLASPRYGERFGRMWLDLVRYAETHGYERDDPKPGAYRFRDYVIRSLNADKPYDQFVTEQLAGDELSGANAETKTATAMYRLGLIDDEPADPVMDRFDQLDDMMKVVGTTFLGLTVHCARCHDHKFDPIPQKDYYRLLAFLTPGERYVRDSIPSISVSLLSAPEQVRVRELERGLERQLGGLRERLEKEGKGKEGSSARKAIEAQIKALEASRPAEPMVLGLTDSGANGDVTRLLVRGDAHSPGEEIEPGFLSALAGTAPDVPFEPSGTTTGRRLALARWITHAQNPLTPRVIVNRLWQAHFGRGIVGTASDFGAMGEEPANPQLLDWLASEFVSRSWSWKTLQRTIVTSAAYRRAGWFDAGADRLDPGNTKHWRYAPRRLEAEPIRDSVLAVSGELGDSMYGPSILPPIDAAVLSGQSVPGKGWKASDVRAAARRSIYVYIKRTLPVPELEVMDAPDSAEPCAQRVTTTTAPQALTMLNGTFWHEQAAHFAARLAREAGPDPAAQVDCAFRLAYARPPAPEEKDEALEFLSAHAARIAKRPQTEQAADAPAESLRAFCLVLLNSNEFLTVD
jgi:hypothetical protein